VTQFFAEKLLNGVYSPFRPNLNTEKPIYSTTHTMGAFYEIYCWLRCAYPEQYKSDTIVPDLYLAVTENYLEW
jgi:hypothetical protein